MGDGLPAFLCNTCADLVVKIWKLKAISEHVDMSLRKLLGNSNALVSSYTSLRFSSCYTYQ